MKVSSPSSYGNIFNVYAGTGTLTSYTMPAHRGIFFASNTTTQMSGITLENIDGSITSIPVIQNVPVLLPIVVKKITIASTISGLRVFGLL